MLKIIKLFLESKQNLKVYSVKSFVVFVRCTKLIQCEIKNAHLQFLAQRSMKFELKMHLINCTLAAGIEGHTINLTIEFQFLHMSKQMY